MKALVTGATGFIGSELVKRLSESGVTVRAIVRHGVVTHRGLPQRVELIRGDVTTPAGLSAAAEGCEVVYHCAWGGRTLDQQRLINVEGTRNVVTAAARAGVHRVVHLSSMAAHGRKLPSVLTEDFPLATRGDPYVVSKAEGEHVAFQVGASAGIEVAVLRPTLVYGRGAPLWVISYFQRVKHEQVRLISRGRGLANLIHVQDLVDGMIACATGRDAAGEAFLMNGEESITWREYLGYFARMCGKPLPSSKPAWLARLEVPFAKLHSILTNQPPCIQNMDILLMTPQCRVSIDKAKRVLGYQPKISIEQGMAQCETWLRQEGYLPST